jgi:hypothetical protein
MIVVPMMLVLANLLDASTIYMVNLQSSRIRKATMHIGTLGAEKANYFLSRYLFIVVRSTCPVESAVSSSVFLVVSLHLLYVSAVVCFRPCYGALFADGITVSPIALIPVSWVAD